MLILLFINYVCIFTFTQLVYRQQKEIDSLQFLLVKSEVYIHLSQIRLNFSQFLTFNPSKNSLS